MLTLIAQESEPLVLFVAQFKTIVVTLSLTHDPNSGDVSILYKVVTEPLSSHGPELTKAELEDIKMRTEKQLVQKRGEMMTPHLHPTGSKYSAQKRRCRPAPLEDNSRDRRRS